MDRKPINSKELQSRGDEGGREVLRKKNRLQLEKRERENERERNSRGRDRYVIMEE